MSSAATPLDPFRRTLDRVRRREDSHNANTLYFGRDALRDVMATLAERVQTKCIRLQIIGDRAPFERRDASAIWSDLAAEDKNIRSVYVVAHLGFLDDELKAQLRDDEMNGITSRVLNIAWLSDDLAATATSDCVLADDSVLVFSPPIARGDGSGLWTITDADEHVASGRRMLNELWDVAKDPAALPAELDLEEPLAQSAKLISEVAPVLCVGDHVDPSGCAWYHGTWQFLRLMDLVSTPSWHETFYTKKLRQAVGNGARSCLVSGTADYSVFAYLVSALGDAANDSKLTVVDRCNTPLFACQWYAKRVGVPITTVSDDIRAYANDHLGQHDLIVTDAFLTRFQGDECRAVLQDWYDMLTVGGSVVTTVRIHSGLGRGQSPEEAVAGFRERASNRWRRWQPFVAVDREVVATLAERYARRMISNPIGGEADILDLLSSRFRIVSTEVASVPGELYPTDYLRVELKKEA